MRIKSVLSWWYLNRSKLLLFLHVVYIYRADSIVYLLSLAVIKEGFTWIRASLKLEEMGMRWAHSIFVGRRIETSQLGIRINDCLDFFLSHLLNFLILQILIDMQRLSILRRCLLLWLFTRLILNCHLYWCFLLRSPLFSVLKYPFKITLRATVTGGPLSLDLLCSCSYWLLRASFLLWFISLPLD